MKIIIDFETRSRCNLKTSGQHIYAKHDSTEILCIGWKIVGEKVSHIIPYSTIYTGGEKDIQDFIKALSLCDFVIAHNAGFEQAIWKYCLLITTSIGRFLPALPIEKWICTLSLCSIAALPRSLEGAGEALGLGFKKDVEGKKLLLLMCKPKRVINDINKWIEWAESDENLKRLYAYCKADLFSEEDLYFRLAKYKLFTRTEFEYWRLNQKQNQRGFMIDHILVKKALELINDEEKFLETQLKTKTFGWVQTAKQTKNFQAWLTDQGFILPNLQKKTVEESIKFIESENLAKNQEVLDVLKIRQSLGKSSTSKFQAFTNRMDIYDKRVRDNLLFSGASTGRDSGQGVQPQNFPRGSYKMIEEYFEDIKNLDLDTLRMLYGRPMDLLSNALRGVIIPTKGKKLYCGDWNSIEARVLLWVAQDFAGLKEYEEGIDPYKSMASTIYGVPYLEVGSDKRQVGKQVILACGYQMGLNKFVITAKNNGLDISEELAKKAHTAFREKYPKVPKVWYNMEKAAIYAVESKKRVTVNRVSWYVQGDFLFCELPSGRKLSYYGPVVHQESTPWGQTHSKLYHWGVDSLTKKWVHSATYGGKLTENVVQAISRDCMKEAELRLENHDYEVLISVHDEILAESASGDDKAFVELMSMRPVWGQDLPLKVEGWSGYRYRK